VLVSDVAARDVQAATSRAYQIARASTKSRVFAGAAAQGKGAAKSESLNGLLRNSGVD
jgi:hypothetical protein